MGIRKEIGSFLVIGIINTLVGLTSIYLLFNLFHISYWWATSMGNAIGMVVSYLLNKRFTFQNKGKDSSSLLRFFVVVLLCYYVSYWVGLHISSFVVIIIPYLQSYKGDASILFGAGLYTISNYFGQKFFVFNSGKNLHNKESF
jgi:putative flippase GtrA